MMYHPRAEWNARPPRYVNTAEMAATPTGHYNGPTVTVDGSTTFDHSRCFQLVRGIQNFHMDSQGWSDIAYNFVICPHGHVFEGRGLKVINGANGTNEGNRTSHAVMWLAGEENPFLEAEKTGYREAISYISANTDAPDDSIGHRDHKATLCPGQGRYDWIHAGMPVVQPAPPTPIEEDQMQFVYVRRADSGKVYAMFSTVVHNDPKLTNASETPVDGRFISLGLPDGRGFSLFEEIFCRGLGFKHIPYNNGGVGNEDVSDGSVVRKVWVIRSEDADAFGIPA